MGTTRPRATLIALLLATLLSAIDVTVVGTAMPRISGQIGSITLYPWVFSIYLLTSTVTVPIWGKLADMMGRRPSFLCGISIFLAGSAACGAAQTMEWLVAARGLQGLGAGAILPLTMTIIGDAFPVESRARIQGVLSLVWGAASILGPAAGGVIVTFFSWRWVFYVNLPVGGIALLLFSSSFHERFERRPAQDVDVAGAVLLGAGVVVSLLATTAVGLRRVAAVALSAVFLVAFVAVERRAREPLVPLSLFRDRVITLAALSGLLTGPMLYASIAYIPLFLQGAMGLEPIWTAVFMAPMSFAWATAAFVAGRWIPRFGFRMVVRTGIALCTTGAALLWLALAELPATLGWILFGAAVLLFGGGLGMNLSTLLIAVQERVPMEQRGTATGLTAFSRQIGAPLGLALLGAWLAASLQRRLEGIPGAPSESALLDPRRLEEVPHAVLQVSRAALDASLVSTFGLVAGVGLIACALTIWFPDMRLTKPTPAAPPSA